MPVSNPASRQIVRRQFEGDQVTEQETDETHTNLARGVRQNAVLVFQFHSEHAVGQRLHHGTLNLNHIPLCHGRSYPLSTIASSGSSWPAPPPASARACRTN